MSKTCNPDSCSTIGVLQLKIDGLESDIAKLCKSLNYIKGIVECGEKRTLSDKEWIDQAVLNYVIKLEQQAKYAELGRLAVQGLSQELSVWHCHGNFDSDLCKWYRKIHGCEHQDFCEKRAELLAEVKHKESKCPNCDGCGFSETLGGHAGGVDCYRCKGTGLVAEVQK